MSGVEHIMATPNCSVLLKFFAYPSHYVVSFFVCCPFLCDNVLLLSGKWWCFYLLSYMLQH